MSYAAKMTDTAPACIIRPHRDTAGVAGSHVAGRRRTRRDKVPGTRRIAHGLPKRVIALVVVTALLFLACSSIAQATPAIDKAKAQAQALLALIEELDEELSAATEEYNYANQQLEDTQAAIKRTTSNITKAEKDLGAIQDQLNERVVNIYKSGNLTMLGVILNTDSFSDLVSRLDQLQRLGRQDADLIDQVQGYKQKVADRKAELEVELRQQQEYSEQTEAAKKKVLAQLEKQKKALKGKEALIAKLKKEEAARQAKLAAEARARRAFLASRPGKVISTAMRYLGVPYVWGGASPRGFDCSGLVQYSFAKVGIYLPHSSRMQYNYGTHVSRSQLKPGDLVFFWNPIHHVGIYIGNGKIVHATGNHVQIGTVYKSSYYGATRIL
jgi:cell wall-associated NlpC family hydrolase